MKWVAITAPCVVSTVALFTRAWIEIALINRIAEVKVVALFTRAWIDILDIERLNELFKGRPLHEGVA